MAKEYEAETRKRLRMLTKQEMRQAERQKLLEEVADLFQVEPIKSG
jgi:hypothetical protein